MTHWRTVPDWDGYEVSDQGTVRSVDRQIPNRHGTLSLRRGQILKPQMNRGYLAVILKRGKLTRTVKVHTLVLEAFDRKRPEGLEGRHLGGNVMNNSITNLKWGDLS